MGKPSKSGPGLVYYRCPRCEKEGLYLACDNCHRTGGFVLEKGAAVCECGHRVESYECPCGANVRRKFFFRDEERERKDREEGVPDRRERAPGLKAGSATEAAAPGPAVLKYVSHAANVHKLATFSVSVVGFVVPASLAKAVFGVTASFGELLLVTAPMTVGVALSTRLLLSGLDLTERILLAALGLIGTAGLGILLGVIGGVSLGHIGAKYSSGIASIFEVAGRVLTTYYDVYGAPTFFSFLAVGIGLGALWRFWPARGV